jgi:hypothetical protein
MEDLFPSENSKTLYIDWVSADGSVLSHSVSPVVEGTTNGQFDIPADYKGSFVHVRAYTKWMLNFDTAFLYNKDIRILASNGPKDIRTPFVTTLQFFPEGGDAIAGVSNRIAFKANDQFGRPVTVKGVIVDEKGTTIDSFRTVHNGMGSVLLTPAIGKVFTARWKDVNGKLQTSLLPTVKADGIAMQVNNNGTRKVITLNGGQLPDELRHVHLVGTMNQRMAFKADVDLTSNTSAKRIIPVENLPSGVLTITVFDRDWNAIAERVSFVNNHEYRFQPTFEVKHWGMGKRKRNEIEIKVPDNLQGASMSISVTDAAIETDSSENIISHFLLSSEIRGKVYDPAYYFSSKDEKTAEDLDLVMMTHGWRRFKWEDVVKGKLPAITYPKDTNYLNLSGQLYGVAKSQLSGSDNIVLMVKEDSLSRMIIMPISTEGSFSDPDIILFDTVRVYYSLKSKFFKTAEARFMLNRLPAPNYTAFSKTFIPKPFNDTTGNYRHSLLASETLKLQQAFKSELMQNVVIKTNQKTPVQVLDEKYTSGFFQGGDGYQFDLVNDPTTAGYMSVLAYLQGKVAGLQIQENPPSLSWRGGQPSVYVDEIASDLSMITSIPVSDIAYVKVFRPPFMGMGGGDGAIAIYTRRGNDMKQASGKGLTSNKLTGYSAIKEFYSPNYDRFDPRNEQADLRTTLYWNPVINTTKGKNTVKLTFYNNDVSQAFRIVIEGISKEGMLTHFEQIME